MGFMKRAKSLFGASNSNAEVVPEDAVVVAQTPESTGQLADRSNDADPSSHANGQDAAVSAAWTMYTADDGVPYYVNNETGESAWELPADGFLDDTADHGPSAGSGPQTGANEDPTANFVPLYGQEAKTWKQHMLSVFQVPDAVSSLNGDVGKRMVFPHVHPVSPLVRVSVLENSEPPRHKIVISLGDPVDEGNDYWVPEHYFYAFACEMPCTAPYTVEFRRDPYATRLNRGKNPQPRDITKWSRQRPMPKGFFAFPEPMPGSAPYFLDWSSGPDRYTITRKIEHPNLGWLRCLRFQAYPASKFHVMETFEPTHVFRVHHGHFCPVDEGWTCLFAFFAFETNVPGTSKYYLQHKGEPYYSIRVAKEPTYAHGWQDYAHFYAFDVPMPGTSRLTADYLTQNVNTRQAVAEQSRIYHQDTWEPWVEKLFFYAFPAPTLQFAPPQG